jgi:DNA replication and repair protein RecF
LFTVYLRNLSLINFKNYRDAELEFLPGVNCFTGNNGAGKTNLLDGVHYLSLCKSYFNPLDNQNIFHKEDFFVIQGTFNMDGKEEKVYCGLKRGEKKQFKRNGKEYPRLAGHIGLFPAVMIAPTDTLLLTGGSEERRKLVDSAISQYDKNYLEDIISYNKILMNRNALLRQFARSRNFDAASLEIWDEQMAPLSDKVYNQRKEFIRRFLPLFSGFYGTVSGGREKVSIVYESQLADGDFRSLLAAAQEKDRAMEYSTLGVHKDDLVFKIGGHPVKKFGSQGQQKSFLVALKLALFEFLKEIKNVKPLLLLDDIFDKLDDSRVENLLRLVSGGGFGQIFITDTHPERVKEIFGKIKMNVRIFCVEEGKIISSE